MANNIQKEKTMKTVLVKFRETIPSGHALLNDVEKISSKIVKVYDLIELNDSFKAITSVVVLEDNTEQKYSEKEVLAVFDKFSMVLPLHYEILVKEHLKNTL